MARNTSFKFYSNINLSPRTNDTFSWANASEQRTFFINHQVASASNCYYQRADINKVKVQISYSTLYRCDYLSFINPDYENKTFYAFVTNVTYIDDTTTEVDYVIDHIQTWYFEMNFHACYVDRQHANRDHIGDNMIMESFDCGTMQDQDYRPNFPNTRMMIVVLATFDVYTWLTTSSHSKMPTNIYIKNGVYDQLSQVAFYSQLQDGTPASNGSALQVFLNNVWNGIGGVTMDDIVAIYIYPSIGLLTVPNPDVEPVIGVDTTLPSDFQHVYKVGGVSAEDVILPSVPTDLNGYTPKNNRMFQYPYTFIHISNNDGSSIDLHYERYRDSNGNIPAQKFVRIQGTTCGEAKLRLTPVRYMGITSASANEKVDYDYALDSGAYPTCSMTGDAYMIYLAQNKNRISNQYDSQARSHYKTGVGMLSTGGQNVAKGAMGGSKESVIGALVSTGASAVGALTNGIFDAYDFLQAQNAKFEDLKIAPATSTGISGVGLAFQHGHPSFSLSVKVIDAQHAKMIDDYYTMFGYPQHKIMVPMLRARTAFTFIKTVGCIITGNIPEYAKSQIEAMFDTGIRLWSDQDHIGNYNVVNDPINS